MIECVLQEKRNMKPEEVSLAIEDLVKRGLIEPYIGEDGDFVFELTEIGKRVAEDIHKSNNNNDV
jgi:DNA-binding MarR family transcriptional regulator|tara:strand:- start:710 stop:904 length:195 start_codon:yes stop_codon:yes gene_type:complete